MKHLVLLLLLAPVLACAQALNPAVTQANIGTTICSHAKVHGKTWIRRARPPASYTNRIKLGLLKTARRPASDAKLFELDHLVSIELGGAPRDPANLWLQPWDGPNGARAKDIVETRLHRAVCRGQITLAAARACIAADWQSCP